MADLRGRLARVDPLLILAVVAAAAFSAFVWIPARTSHGTCEPQGEAIKL